TASGEVLDVAFSPDCRAIAAAVKDAGLFLWNLDSPTIASVRLTTERYRAGSLTFSPNSRQLVWLTTAGRRVYDRDTRTAAPEPAESPSFALISSDGMRGVSNAGLPDYSLAGWQLKEGEWVRQWQLSTRELFIGSLTLATGFDKFAMFTRAENDPWR